MAEIILITGGQRSGKSQYAQKLAGERSVNPVYLATARVWDNDFKKRIEYHQKNRGKQWTTIEEEKHLSHHKFDGKTVVLDCITLWLTNIFHDNGYGVKQSLAEVKGEWTKFINQDFTLIVVSNELGMGIIPENEASRKFADLQGWTNQHVASLAGSVFFMISGIPLKIK